MDHRDSPDQYRDGHASAEARQPIAPDQPADEHGETAADLGQRDQDGNQRCAGIEDRWRQAPGPRRDPGPAALLRDQ